MQNTTIVTPGTLEAIGGGIKKTVGRMLGNDELEARGRAEELQGQERIQSSDRKSLLAEQVATVVEGADAALQQVGGAVAQVAGAVQGTVGELLDKPTMQAEGKVKESAGRAQRKAATGSKPKSTK